MLKIDQALLSHFIGGNYGLPVAHENQPYQPTNGQPYAEVLVIQNSVTPFSLASSNETDGIFRVILRYPADGGAVPAKQKAEAISNGFAIGSRLEYQGVAVTITAQSRVPGVPEDGWYKQVLTFNYRAFTDR